MEVGVQSISLFCIFIRFFVLFLIKRPIFHEAVSPF